MTRCDEFRSHDQLDEGSATQPGARFLSVVIRSLFCVYTLLSGRNKDPEPGHMVTMWTLYTMK